MSKLNQYNLGLFLTEKNSLNTWEKAGILSREIAPYNILADYFKKVFIFSYGDESDRRFQAQLAQNIEIVPRSPGSSLKKYYWLLPFVHQVKIRRCHFLKTNQFKSRAALIAKILNPRNKLIIRTGYIPSLFEKQEKGKASHWLKWWEKWAYRLCNSALVTSQEDRRYLIQNYKIKPEKVTVIANYVDTDLFSPQVSSRGEDRVVFVGRLNPQKNLPLLIRALSGTNLGLDVIGQTDTAGQKELKSELIKLAEGEKVLINFLGILPNRELPKILNNYAIFVLPSLYEGTPKSLLEAMSCGLACVATDVPGSRKLIQHEKTGLLAEVNSGSLQEKILQLKNNPSRRLMLGQKARELVINNFSLHSQIKKEIALYENLI